MMSSRTVGWAQELGPAQERELALQQWQEALQLPVRQMGLAQQQQTLMVLAPVLAQVLAEAARVGKSARPPTASIPTSAPLPLARP